MGLLGISHFLDFDFDPNKCTELLGADSGLDLKFFLYAASNVANAMSVRCVVYFFSYIFI